MDDKTLNILLKFRADLGGIDVIFKQINKINGAIQKSKTTYKLMGDEIKSQGDKWIDVNDKIDKKLKKFDSRLLSIMFGMMAISRGINSFFRDSVAGFMRVDEKGQRPFTKGVMQLSAAFEYLKYVMFESLGSSEAFQIIIVHILNLVQWLGNAIQNNPLATAGGLMALFGLGKAAEFIQTAAAMKLMIDAIASYKTAAAVGAAGGKISLASQAVGVLSQIATLMTAALASPLIQFIAISAIILILSDYMTKLQEESDKAFDIKNPEEFESAVKDVTTGQIELNDKINKGVLLINETEAEALGLKEWWGENSPTILDYINKAIVDPVDNAITKLEAYRNIMNSITGSYSVNDKSYPIVNLGGGNMSMTTEGIADLAVNPVFSPTIVTQVSVSGGGVKAGFSSKDTQRGNTNPPMELHMEQKDTYYYGAETPTNW